jgi:hypothetical protein
MPEFPNFAFPPINNVSESFGAGSIGPQPGAVPQSSNGRAQPLDNDLGGQLPFDWEQYILMPPEDPYSGSLSFHESRNTVDPQLQQQNIAPGPSFTDDTTALTQESGNSASTAQNSFMEARTTAQMNPSSSWVSDHLSDD